MSANLHSNGVAGLYSSYSTPLIHKKAIAAMPTIVLLFLVPILPIGHHLPLVRNQVKVNEASHV
jgi:hypothetical protein